MIQDQDLQAYPASVGGTLTNLTIYFSGRQTQGVGTFGQANMPATLVIAFPNGRSDLMRLSALREIIITHALNDPAFTSWWSPANQTLEAALRAVLGAVTLRTVTSHATIYLWWDGQFGPALVT